MIFFFLSVEIAEHCEMKPGQALRGQLFWFLFFFLQTNLPDLNLLPAPVKGLFLVNLPISPVYEIVL